MFNKIFVFNGSCRLAHTTAALRLVITQGLSLGIATVGDGYHSIFFGDQIFYSEVVHGFNNFSATLIAKLFNNRFQLFADNRH